MQKDRIRHCCNRLLWKMSCNIYTVRCHTIPCHYSCSWRCTFVGPCHNLTRGNSESYLEQSHQDMIWRPRSSWRVWSDRTLEPSKEWTTLVKSSIRQLPFDLTRCYRSSKSVSFVSRTTAIHRAAPSSRCTALQYRLACRTRRPSQSEDNSFEWVHCSKRSSQLSCRLCTLRSHSPSHLLQKLATWCC